MNPQTSRQRQSQVYPGLPAVSMPRGPLSIKTWNTLPSARKKKKISRSQWVLHILGTLNTYTKCASLWVFFLPFSLRRRHSPWRAHVTRVTDTRRPPHATSSRLHVSHLLSLLSMPSSCSIVLGYGVAITKSQLIPPLWSLLIEGNYS